MNAADLLDEPHRSCQSCKKKKKRCEVFPPSTSCLRCQELQIQCAFDELPDKRLRRPRSVDMTELAEMFMERFFIAAQFKVEVVPQKQFRGTLAYYSGKYGAPPPPAGWSMEPQSPLNTPPAFFVVFNAVIAIGAALSGNKEEATKYHALADEALKGIDLVSALPSPPLVSGILTLGYLAQGLSQDRARSSFLYSMAADMAAKCPHLTASVRMGTLLVSDHLNSASAAPASTTGITALASQPSVEGVQVGGMSPEDFDTITRGIGLTNAIIFRGLSMPYPSVETAAVRFGAAAQRCGVCEWLPVALINSILRLVMSAKTRTISRDEVEAALFLLAEPFKGPQQTLLVFAVVAQLVVALHGPVLEGCGTTSGGADTASSVGHEEDEDDDYDDQDDRSYIGTGFGLSTAPSSLSHFSAVSGTSAAHSKCSCPSVSSAASRSHPAAALLLPASTRLLEMLTPTSVNTGIDAQAASTPSSSSSSSSSGRASPAPVIQPTLPPGILPWHLLIMDGLHTEGGARCTPLSGPLERLAFGSSYLGQTEGLFRTGIKAALCAKAYLSSSASNATAFSSNTSSGIGLATAGIYSGVSANATDAATDPASSAIRVMSICAPVESEAVKSLLATSAPAPTQTFHAFPSSSSASASSLAPMASFSSLPPHQVLPSSMAPLGRHSQQFANPLSPYFPAAQPSLQGHHFLPGDLLQPQHPGSSDTLSSLEGAADNPSLEGYRYGPLLGVPKMY